MSLRSPGQVTMQMDPAIGFLCPTRNALVFEAASETASCIDPRLAWPLWGSVEPDLAGRSRSCDPKENSECFFRDMALERGMTRSGQTGKLGQESQNSACPYARKQDSNPKLCRNLCGTETPLPWRHAGVGVLCCLETRDLKSFDVDKTYRNAAGNMCTDRNAGQSSPSPSLASGCLHSSYLCVFLGVMILPPTQSGYVLRKSDLESPT